MVLRKNKTTKSKSRRRKNKTTRRGGSAMFKMLQNTFKPKERFPLNNLPSEMRKRVESQIRMFGRFDNPGKTPYNGSKDPVKEYCAELSKANYLTPEMEADLNFCKENKLI
jgi:hypothetical protein